MLVESLLTRLSPVTDLDTRRWEDEEVGRQRWVLLHEVPDWAPNNYSEDQTIVSELQTARDLEFRHLQCSAYFGDGKKASLPPAPL